jgi:biotin synthase-like enzyme
MAVAVIVPENCKYCAQSAHNHTDCEVYGFLDADTIVKTALENEKEGADRFAIVTSGRGMEGEDFEKCIAVFKRMHKECKIELCASLGLLTPSNSTVSTKLASPAIMKILKPVKDISLPFVQRILMMKR